MARSPEVGRPESGPGKDKPKIVAKNTLQSLGKTAIKGANKK
jgi:hypothetical protein